MTERPTPDQDPFSKPARARMARVLAVQAIYQMRMAQGDVDEILDHYTQEELSGMKGRKTDKKLFITILSFLKNEPQTVMDLLSEELAPKYTLERLEAVLQAILVAATCEACVKITPPAILINEYIQVTNGFFHGEESKLVNGVLDKVVQKVSPPKMS